MKRNKDGKLKTPEVPFTFAELQDKAIMDKILRDVLDVDVDEKV